MASAKLSITLPAKQAAHVRKAWEEGIASGTAGEWDVEEFLRSARERKAKRASSKRPVKASR